MIESMLNVTTTIRRCIAVANAIVVKRNVSLISTAITVMSGCRLITVATVLTVLNARIRSVASSLLLAAFANAKIFIVTTIARNRLVSTITTVETTATKFA